MSRLRYTHASAFANDGNVYHWLDNPTPTLIPKIAETWGHTIARIYKNNNSNSNSDGFFALVDNGHILTWSNKLVCEDLDPNPMLQTDTDLPPSTIPDCVATSNGDMLVAVGNTVTRVMRDDRYCLCKFQVTLESPVNLISYYLSSGFIRTCENRLYRFAYMRDAVMGGDEPIPNQDYELIELNFSQADCIRKIVCELSYDLFLMVDGTVHISKSFGTGNDPIEANKHMPLHKIPFPSGESVIDIVHSVDISDSEFGFIIYIMESGVCYYSKEPIHAAPNGLNKLPAHILLDHDKADDVAFICPHPTPIHFLTDYFIEKAYILDTAIMFQCSSNRLCIVNLECTQSYRPWNNYIVGINPLYWSGEMRELGDRRTDDTESVVTHSKGSDELEPVVIEFPTDTSIELVEQVGEYIYFTTDTGQLYYGRYDTEPGHVQLERMQFFDANPIVIDKQNHTQPRSAGSLLKD